METFGIHIPTKVIFGRGSIAKLKEVVPLYGKKALLLTTGEDLRKVGTLDRALNYLNEAHVKVVADNTIEPNPKTYNIDHAVKVMLDEECDVVIGLGGGSSMDAAKATAFVAKNGGTIQEYILEGKRAKEIQTETFPIICVTTTAGTGSEVTNVAVITDPVTKEKPGLLRDCLYPDVSIVDPDLTVTLPIGVTAGTGVDVFYHAMESYIATVATPFTDLVALEAMNLVKENLHRVYKDAYDIEARTKMAWANTLAGLCITSSSTVAIHAIGHSVSGITDVSHAWGLCTIAKSYLDYSYDADIERYATISRILSAPDSLSDKEAAKFCGEYFLNFLNDFNMPTSLSDVGLGEKNIDKIAADTFHAMNLALSVSLKKLSMQDVKFLLKKSL
jgi:alcohol dehydrogenase